MARRKISLDTWNSLVDSFRSNPFSIGVASRRTGLDRRTCSKAWNQGLPAFAGGESIKSIMQREEIEARAELERENLEARQRAQDKYSNDLDHARENAIQARTAEGQMVDLGRSNAVKSLQAVAELLTTAEQLAQRTRDKLDTMLREDKENSDENNRCPFCDHTPTKFTPGEIISLLERIGLLSKRITEQAEIAMRMERLHLGQPTDILGWTDEKEITTADAEERMSVAGKAVESALKRRAMKEAAASLKKQEEHKIIDKPN